MKMIEDLGMIYPSPKSTKKARYAIYECVECKTHFRTSHANAKKSKSGKCKSCGAKKHGDKGERLYDIWCLMKARCYNKNLPQYSRYGGRGIKISKKWKDNYPNFKKWAMKNGYTADLTIDRIDNDGNYKSSNCRWTTWKVQANNRSNSLLKKFTIDELSDICELYENTNATFVELANYMGVSKSSVGNLIHGMMSNQEDTGL